LLIFIIVISLVKFKFCELFVFVVSHKRKVYKNRHNKTVVPVTCFMNTAHSGRIFNGKMVYISMRMPLTIIPK